MKLNPKNRTHHLYGDIIVTCIDSIIYSGTNSSDETPCEWCAKEAKIGNKMDNNTKCPDCGHVHEGAAMGYICIGCRCETRPVPVEAPTPAEIKPIDLDTATEIFNLLESASFLQDELNAARDRIAQLESPWIPASTPPTEYSSWIVQLKGGFITDDTFHVVDQSWGLHGNEVEAYQPMPAPYIPDKEQK